MTPKLADRLCSLAMSQPQMQTARSAALDTAAIGVMAIDAALATIVLSEGRTHLCVIALSLLGLSLMLAFGALSSSGAEQTGPSIVRMRRDTTTHDDMQLTERLLDGCVQDIDANAGAISYKATLLDAALMFVAFAIAIELAGRL